VALALLLSTTLASAVKADNIQKSQSPFVGKLGQSVASSNISIVDDGHLPQAFGSRPFDDEGFPTQTTKIIDKGRLRSFLYNTYASNKDRVKSTGNSLRSMGGFGTRQRYCVEPLIGSTNFRLFAGVKGAEDSYDSVVSEVKNGIIAKGVIGAHTANPQSGEFSVALDLAYKVEKGETSFPVKQAMVGGNIQDLLKNVSLLANDVTHVGWEHSSIITPTVLVKNVRVSG
jgi:PmbA protein